MSGEALTKTLVLEIALPDFHAEDLDPDSESLREFYGDEDGLPLTPEQFLDAFLNESAIITGGHVRVLVLTGDKGGEGLHRMDGWIVGAKVVPRTAEHEGEKDERLDYHENEWALRESRV